MYKSKEPPPYKPARLRSPAGMMKMLRDDYMRMKLAGQIYIPKASKIFHISERQYETTTA
jgi:hypothetical protein